jgi:hypothetical protein
MGFQSMRQKGAVVAGVAGMSALLVGCSASARPEIAASYGATGVPVSSTVAPMAVSCEPNQRAVVRQVAVNGMMQAQVQCESVNGVVAGTSGFTPVAYQPGVPVPVGYGVAGVQPVSYVQPALPDTQYVRAPTPIVRQAAPQRVAYQRAPERVVKQGRSVKKSAIIIGSSAGVGAGVGAAVGGKKGAGIGALIGGGGAAIWDQITRRK